STRGGAVVFARTGSTWSQEGSALIPAAGGAGGQLGTSVALSAEGDYALAGAPFDMSVGIDEGIGAAWMFTRNAAPAGPPEILSVTPGAGSATLALAMPAELGGSWPISYTITASPGGA